MAHVTVDRPGTALRLDAPVLFQLTDHGRAVLEAYMDDAETVVSCLEVPVALPNGWYQCTLACWARCFGMDLEADYCFAALHLGASA